MSGTLKLNTEKSVGGHGKKSITLLFFEEITFYLAVKCKRFLVNKAVKFQIKTLNSC